MQKIKRYGYKIFLFNNLKKKIDRHFFNFFFNFFFMQWFCFSRLFATPVPLLALLSFLAPFCVGVDEDPRLVAVQLIGRDEERLAHCLEHREVAVARDVEYFERCVASSLCFLKRYAECRDEFRSFIAKYPRSEHQPWAHVSLGFALNGLGDMTGAEAAYRLAGEDGCMPLAHMKMKEQRCGEAVPLYECALAHAEKLQDPVQVAESLVGEVGCRNRVIGQGWSAKYFERGKKFTEYGGLSQSHLLANRCREFFAGISPAKCVEMMEEQAGLFVAGDLPRRPYRTWPSPARGSAPLRVAYISSRGFDGDILSTRLTQSLFGQHDRKMFTVICISFGSSEDQDDVEGRGSRSPERELVKRSCDEFVTVGSDGVELAEAVRRLKVDVTVDLQSSHAKGQYVRLRLRPALVQVHYHGTPGTMGSADYDHIITDPLTTPPAARLVRALFTEGLLLLSGSGSYLYSSHRSAYPWWTGGAKAVEAAEAEALPAALPPRSARVFVFCTFNAPFKLTPGLWRALMGALRRTRRSVLWMLAFYPEMEAGLKRETELAGVDPRRVIVTPLLPRNVEYAAKARCDLFVDSPLFSGHSTVLDALHAGVPVLTAAATPDMVSRVGLGLVITAGLNRAIFVVESEESGDLMRAIEDRAVWLANDPAGKVNLAQAREMLLFERPAVFDESAGARRIERALLAAYESKRECVFSRRQNRRGECRKHVF